MEHPTAVGDWACCVGPAAGTSRAARARGSEERARRMQQRAAWFEKKGSVTLPCVLSLALIAARSIDSVAQ